MPSFTPNLNLPYPGPSDRPCEFDEQWCDFTEAVDSSLLTLERGLARTFPTIPVAILRQSKVVAVPNANAMPFDTVTIDTDNMTDIDVDPYAIFTRRPGRYTLSAFVFHPGTAFTDTQNAFMVAGTSVFATINLGSGPAYKLTNYLPVLTLPAGERITMNVNTGASGNYNLQAYWLAVAWHSDAEGPL